MGSQMLRVIWLKWEFPYAAGSVRGRHKGLQEQVTSWVYQWHGLLHLWQPNPGAVPLPGAWGMAASIGVLQRCGQTTNLCSCLDFNLTV